MSAAVLPLVRRPVAAALARDFARTPAPVGSAPARPAPSRPAAPKRALRLAFAPLAMTFAGAALAQTPPAAEPVLPPVQVRDKADADDRGYQGTRTRVGKSVELPRDIPQSVTIITEDLIRDRGADTLKDALRNAVGVTFNAGEGGRNGDNVTIRGFSAVGDLYLDGVRDIAQYNRETFNLSQIDVLRGSASVLFGRGSTGGIVNQVSKVPRLVNADELSLGLGTYEYKRLTADVNRVIGQDAAVRINALAHDSGSFRDWVHQERYGVAPSVSWGIGTRDEVTLAGYWLKEDNVPDYGAPFFSGKPLDVPVDRFYGLANADYEKYETSIATATWTHRATRDLEFRTLARYGHYDRDLWPSAPRLAQGTTVVTDDTVMTRGRPGRDGTDEDWTVQADANWRFTTGALRHQLLAGVEYASERSRTTRWSNAPGAVPTTIVGNPDPFPALPADFGVRTNPTTTRFTSDNVGLYAQDTVTFLPQWKLVLGARHDDFSADYERAAPLGPLSRNDRVWSWRTGLLWQPTDEQSYYVSYGTSFNPSGELYALDPRSVNTPPEESQNVEAGAKWDLLDGDLSLRTAVFRSEKTNERNTDPLIADVYLLSGKRHTDGIEIEGAGRITPAWEVFGGVAWMRGRIDQSINPADEGKWPVNTPPYTANLWTTWRFAQYWRVGGGVEAVGRRYTSVANTTVLPSYVRADAMLEYDRGTWAVRLNVQNLFDEKYYEGLYTAHAVPGTARVAQLTGIYRF